MSYMASPTSSYYHYHQSAAVSSSSGSSSYYQSPTASVPSVPYAHNQALPGSSPYYQALSPSSSSASTSTSTSSSSLQQPPTPSYHHKPTNGSYHQEYHREHHEEPANPSYHHESTTPSSVREASILAAIQDLQQGKYTSERAAALAHRIPRSTLRDRLSGRVVQRTEAHADQQRLTPAQEELLAYWIQELRRFGNEVDVTRVREMAGKMLEGDAKPLGKLWVKNFIRRNPKVGWIKGAS